MRRVAGRMQLQTSRRPRLRLARFAGRFRAPAASVQNHVAGNLLLC